MERQFINDAVLAERQRTRYRDTLLPKYDASTDPNCAAYFSKPNVRLQVVRTKYREFPVSTWRLRPYTPLLPRHLRSDLSAISCRPNEPLVYRESYNLANQQTLKRYGSVSDLESIYQGKSSPRRSKAGPGQLRAAESLVDLSGRGRPNVNKLSYRRLVAPTPPSDVLREREQSFVNDGVRSNNLRTRYKDLIPPYDARADVHASGYHRRGDVTRLVSVTRSVKPTAAKPGNV